MIAVVTFIILKCASVFTHNLWLLMEPQRLQIKAVIDILGAALDTVLQFAFEILFSTKSHISLYVFYWAT